MEIWKADPLFTNFMPTTAVEAVDRYIRCRRKGLAAMMIPECLVACARALSPEECSKFEEWIVCPTGDLSGASLVEQKTIRQANDEVFEQLAAKVENKIADAELCDDEKVATPESESEVCS